MTTLSTDQTTTEVLTDAIDKLRRGLERTTDQNGSCRTIRQEGDAGSGQFNKSDWHQRSEQLARFGISPTPSEQNRTDSERVFRNQEVGAVGASCAGYVEGVGEHDRNRDNLLASVYGESEQGRHTSRAKTSWIITLKNSLKECPSKFVRNASVLFAVAYLAGDFVLKY